MLKFTFLWKIMTPSRFFEGLTALQRQLYKKRVKATQLFFDFYKIRIVTNLSSKLCSRRQTLHQFVLKPQYKPERQLRRFPMEIFLSRQ